MAEYYVLSTVSTRRPSYIFIEALIRCSFIGSRKYIILSAAITWCRVRQIIAISSSHRLRRFGDYPFVIFIRWFFLR